MARPVTDTPRLSGIDPAQLARDVERGAIDHLASQMISFAGDAPSLPPQMRQLYHAVIMLADYAVGDADLEAPVHEYWLSLLPLWTYAMGGASVHTPEFDAAMSGDLDSLADDWQGRLVLVMVAADARERIASGQPVTAAQLASLASLSPQSVRLLARQGEVEIVEGECRATEARRWLGGRGVEV